MGAADAAAAYEADMAALSRQAQLLILREWEQINADDISGSWQALVPHAAAAATAAQGVAAEFADPYLSAAVPGSAAGYAVNTTAFAGVTDSAGGTVESLFYLPVIDAKQAIAAGAAPDIALKQAVSQLAMYAQTMIADAGRLSTAAAMGSRPHVKGYYRMLTPPSCSRCAVLAGRFYRYNQGFARHPRCDCRHVPVAEADDSLLFDPRKAIEAGQVTGLSKAETTAIVDYGADPAQVVNIHRKGGMYTAGGAKFTHEGTTRRGVAGARILARDLDRAHGVDIRQKLYTNVVQPRRTTADMYAALFRKGKTYTRTTAAGRTQSYAYQFTRSRRLTPEQILADASGRADAIRQLVNHGYILDLRDTAAALRRGGAPVRAYADRVRDALTGDRALGYTRISLVRNTERLAYDDASFLRQYKGTAYANINEVLRREKGNLPGTFGFDYYREATGVLDKVMTRSATRSEAVVYRGISSGEAVFGPAWEQRLVGAEWTEHAYVSTSAVEQTALDLFHQPGGAVMRLLVPKGVGAVQLSGPDYEAELLLQRGLRMRVVADSGPGTHPRRIDIEVLR
jgi:hypothetical protein